MPDTIKSATPGKLRVLLIDLTRNAKGFEHALSIEISQKLKSSGVELASEGPLLLDSDEELAARFTRSDLTFSALFLMAHSSPDPGDGTVSAVATPGGSSHWYHLAGLLPNLRDKLVCLAVCYGSCADAVQALTEGEQFALALVAPISELSKEEARAFYPAFFDELNRSCATSIPPELVKICVKHNNHLAKDKIRVY
jgi:hypothetical protein